MLDWELKGERWAEWWQDGDAELKTDGGEWQPEGKRLNSRIEIQL